MAMVQIYDEIPMMSGALLSFYPMGIFIIGSKDYSLLKHYKLNELIIDGSNMIVVDITNVQRENFPFSILENMNITRP